MKTTNHMLYISTTITQEQLKDISPEHAAELCSNWWPTPGLAIAENVPGMPHPLCRMCANWLPDIEDMGVVLHNTCSTKKAGCGNDWPKERNLRSSLLPISFLSTPKKLE